MSRRVVVPLLSLLILLGTLLLAFETSLVRAFGPVYIRADGSVEGTTYIETVDNFTYVFVADINSPIVVERNDIVIDGNGYAVQGMGLGSETGIDLSERTNVTVRNAQIRGFDVGIGLISCSSNFVFGNNVTNNYVRGIYLSDSSNNTLVSNTMANNGYNFDVDGLSLPDFVNYVDASNTVDGKQVCYWVDKENANVPSDAGYVALVNCTGITVRDLDLTSNGEGILLAYTINSTIIQNDVANNLYGISLVDSSNNTISGNTLTNNGPGVYLSIGGGITLDYAPNNVLRNNTMVGNAANFHVYGSSLSDYLNDMDTSNTVEGKPVYYWVNEKEKVIPSDAGYVALVNCTRITVQDLNLKNNSPDVLLAYTADSTIALNTITPVGSNGIYLWHSSGNNVIENEMMNSIELHYSSSCNITGNAFSGSGLFVTSSFGNVVKDNTVNGKPLIYLEDVSGKSVTDAGQVILVNCNEVSVRDLTLSNTVAGLLLQGTNDSIATGNTITDNWIGIWLGESSNNTVVANNIENNRVGVFIYQSSRNSIYHNNFVDNSEQVHVTLLGYANSWDDGYPHGGNYWGGFNPADENKDKIGDVPYNIDENNTDRYPLIYRFERYESGYTPNPDLSKDGFVNILDVSMVSRAFGCRPGDSHWNPMADMDMNEVINIIDVSKVARHFGEKM